MGKRREKALPTKTLRLEKNKNMAEKKINQQKIDKKKKRLLKVGEDPMKTRIRKVSLENLLVGQCATERVPGRTLYI